jgi:hypothetical protein
VAVLWVLAGLLIRPRTRRRPRPRERLFTGFARKFDCRWTVPGTRCGYLTSEDEDDDEDEDENA